MTAVMMDYPPVKSFQDKCYAFLVYFNLLVYKSFTLMADEATYVIDCDLPSNHLWIEFIL